jgi:hypothetical protein
MDKKELLNLLKDNLSINVTKDIVRDYSFDGRPYTDERLVVKLMFGDEQIDYDYISLKTLK